MRGGCSKKCCDVPVFFRAIPRRGLLSVSAESSQRPWRLRRWSNERRVRSTALRCSPNGGRAELAHPCAQTSGSCSAVRLRFSASQTAPFVASLSGRPWPAFLRGGVSGVMGIDSAGGVREMLAGVLPARVAGRGKGIVLPSSEARMAAVGGGLSPAPLHDAEHRSAKREQGAHVRAQGCASSRRPAWREKRREVEATRRRRNRRVGRNGFGDFCRNKSRTLAVASGTVFGQGWFAA